MKAVVVEDLEERTSASSATHMNYIVQNKGGMKFQVNVDVQARKSPDVKMFIVENFEKNPVFAALNKMPESDGLVDMTKDAYKACRMDYVRTGLFTPTVLAETDVTPPLKIQELLDQRIKVGSTLLLMGESYSDVIPRRADSEVPHGLHRYAQNNDLPPQGIHNVHFNQGCFKRDNRKGYKNDGIFQDGCIILVNGDGTATGFFFMFQKQSPYTDDDGHPIDVDENMESHQRSSNVYPAVCR